ncbi:tetraspanin-9-like [Oscarella lobularis]|uniref:tetraspanin-9-like n=1 Tax=Oscarella lobularis TaxID=121494 RepID=UPI0033137EB6
MGVDLSGGWKFGKYLIFFFNLVFWIFGLALIVVGAIAMDKYGSIFNLDPNQSWTSGPALVIAVGCIIFVIAFFGCIGAIGQNRPLLYIFAVLMSIMFILTIVGVILVVVYKNQIEAKLKDAMLDSMIKYNETGTKKVWDGMQSKWPKCCGTNNYTDWCNRGMSVPMSCCIDETANCPFECGSNDTSNIRTKGCYDETIGAVQSHWPAAAGVSGGVAVVELLAVILGCGLAHAISQGKYEVV